MQIVGLDDLGSHPEPETSLILTLTLTLTCGPVGKLLTSSVPLQLVIGNGTCASHRRLRRK